jgi:hypothetical protein
MSKTSSDVIRRLEAATLTMARAIAGGRRELSASFNPVTGIVQVYQHFRVVTRAWDREREIDEKEAARLGWQQGEYLVVELLHGERDRERMAAYEARYGALLGLAPCWRSFGQTAAAIVRHLLLEEAGLPARS